MDEGRERTDTTGADGEREPRAEDALDEDVPAEDAHPQPTNPTPYPRNRPATPPSADPRHEPPELIAAPARLWRSRPALIWRIAVSLVSAAALVATGVAWATVNWFQHSTNTTDVLTDLGDDPHAPPANDGATDILLVGNDTRTDARGNPLPLDVLKKLRTEATTGLNTDTIMVLRIPRGDGQAEAVSIPRDTYTTIPGMPDNKINAAYGLTRKRTEDELRATGGASDAEIERAADRAGRRALVRSVQDLTGLRVDHYAEVSLYGFYLLTQAIGGVPVCLNNATTDKDSGADFKAGPQTVSGADALAFVRQRENLPHGDLDRIVRQQVFLAAAAKKVLSAGTLTDPKKLSSLVNTIEKSLTVDNKLNILGFVQQAQSLVSGDVKFVTIPVTSLNGHSPDGQSIVTVDKAQVREFIRSIVRHSPHASTGSESPSSGYGGSAPSSPGPGVGAPKQGADGGVVPAVVHATVHTTVRTTVHAGTPTDGDAPTPPVTVDGTRCVD